MTIFNLPDLGEGLPDAEIHKWYVDVNDDIKADEPLVAMETAKAIVDIPAPQSGKIKKLYGQPGDIIKTGEPLVEFEAVETATVDQGTVVGHIEVGTQTLKESSTIGAITRPSQQTAIKATPAVRALAKKLNIDLNAITPSGKGGIITAEDIKQTSQSPSDTSESQPLHGVRRTMAITMEKSQREVVPVSIFDDADIHAWSKDTDITVRLIQALCHACHAEPALNAWYDGQKRERQLYKEINLGLALDTGEDLFLPTIKDAANKTSNELRQRIDQLKQSVKDRSISSEDLQGGTIILSNFGIFAGRYASPIVIPPTVAILAVGQLRDAVVAHEGQAVVHRIIPLSLTFDHRAVTGAEATRFLGEVIKHLQDAQAK